VKGSDQHTSETILKQTYQHFNDRNIDATLAVMHPDVDWPNGMEGGIEHGHEAVRNYWTRQWELIDPHVEPVQFNQEEEGRINVTVHQVVHDMNGNLLIDQVIHHIYTLRDGLIKSMEIRKTN
jgi:ketosteroid isomerase-like protein